MPTLPFDRCLAAARDGDPHAWAQLYDEVAPLVLGYLRRQRAPEPEDLTGEVLLQVVRDLDSFGGDHHRFRSWVLSIAHHRLLDARRYHQRRPVTPAGDTTAATAVAPDDPATEVLTLWELDEVAHLLERLTPDQRDVVLLRVIGDLTVEETARLVGKRPGAVKALQHRAIVTLRHSIAPQRTVTIAERAPVPVPNTGG